jgi:hypothetical protein
MPLVTRQYGPNAKNLKLSFYDMDMNLYYLQELGVSGFSYSNGTINITNPTGGTKSVTINKVTGFTYNNLNTFTITDNYNNNFSATINTVTGLTVNGTISATTYQNLPTDIRVTGGTYSNGTTIFTNNTGGTFNVTGFYTGLTDVYITGGTFSAGTITFTNTTGGTFNVTGITTTPSVNYTIYKALVSLSGGIFTVTQLENTIGDGSGVSPNDIQWSNPNNGIIRATKTGAFTSSNILISVENINGGGVLYICTGQKSTSNFISINIFLYDGTLLSTPNFSNLPVEIRIYN